MHVLLATSRMAAKQTQTQCRTRCGILGGGDETCAAAFAILISPSSDWCSDESRLSFTIYVAAVPQSQSIPSSTSLERATNQIAMAKNIIFANGVV
jgi:hypothetical protein